MPHKCRVKGNTKLWARWLQPTEGLVYTLEPTGKPLFIISLLLVSHDRYAKQACMMSQVEPWKRKVAGGRNQRVHFCSGASHCSTVKSGCRARESKRWAETSGNKSNAPFLKSAALEMLCCKNYFLGMIKSGTITKHIKPEFTFPRRVLEAFNMLKA